MHCVDKDITSMDCSLASESVCRKDMNGNDQLLECNYGGCYASCTGGEYAEKSPHYATCGTESDCSHNQGSVLVSRVCACRSGGSSGSSSGSSTILTVGEVIGIACGVFFFLVFVLAMSIYAYQVYTGR
jgi:hypothetical protein